LTLHNSGGRRRPENGDNAGDFLEENLGVLFLQIRRESRLIDDGIDSRLVTSDRGIGLENWERRC
jgi:hypothetical protein